MKPTPLLLTCLIGLAVPRVGLAQPTIPTQPQSQANVVGTDATFTKITVGDPVNEAVEFYGCAWIDYDNDGSLDLFVTTRAGTHNYLYRNIGQGSFAKVTT